MTQISFLTSHRCFDEVATRPYGNRVTVAAGASDGAAVVSVRAIAPGGHNIGGLLTADDARKLAVALEEAILYAEQIAREQRVAQMPLLREKLAQAQRDAEA